ncbi:hypothetical protein E3N88_34914 [Mikania micrantha]|uniref:Uncharacterized protein n=1 Tax=Mikania micrantha TaxID=192012 RepID=A0A5N6LZH8_9ASTR|nr:hypothetical protein E3N88_34914 [Mikania micrantha]
MQYRLIASQYSYIICGVVPKLTVVPPAMSITRQWQSVGQYCTHSDLKSGWPPRRDGWGLSGPNSTIQDYHARRYALLTVMVAGIERKQEMRMRMKKLIFIQVARPDNPRRIAWRPAANLGVPRGPGSQIFSIAPARIA